MQPPFFARAPRTLVFVLAALASPAFAASLTPETEQALDALVTKALADKASPSVSVAVVKDGKIAYARAYGDARLAPDVPATADMRYKVASNSKQFAATAVLLLAEAGKLKLDDPVAKYFPQLMRAKDITLRMLLGHMSGYSDYYAPDYLQPSMTKPVTPLEILKLHATSNPLDFEPGTRFQYSNTNYVILGQVVEKVSGQPLMAFLKKRVFDKLHMDSAMDGSAHDLGPNDPDGHTRYAMGPVRKVPGEGPGWMYATGELAMTASDMARWDISLMDGTILKPASLRTMTTVGLLKDGTPTNYGLGLFLSQMPNGHRKWSHTGGASGFLSTNTTYPDDHMAVTVFTNGEGRLYSTLARDIEKLLFADAADPKAEASLAEAKKIFLALQKGTALREAMTDDLAGWFSPTVLADFAASLAPLGEVSSFTQANRSERGGMDYRIFNVKMSGGKTVSIAAYVKPDGRFDQFLVSEKT
jgi:D-alanyl-D-alanine carboxypeptidase